MVGSAEWSRWEGSVRGAVAVLGGGRGERIERLQSTLLISGWRWSRSIVADPDWKIAMKCCAVEA